jgi:hypothetical protein
MSDRVLLAKNTLCEGEVRCCRDCALQVANARVGPADLPLPREAEPLCCTQPFHSGISTGTDLLEANHPSLCQPCRLARRPTFSCGHFPSFACESKQRKWAVFNRQSLGLPTTSFPPPNRPRDNTPPNSDLAAFRLTAILLPIQQATRPTSAKQTTWLCSRVLSHRVLMVLSPFRQLCVRL